MQLRPIRIEQRLVQLPPRFRGRWKDRSCIDRTYESGRQCGAIWHHAEHHETFRSGRHSADAWYAQHGVRCRADPAAADTASMILSGWSI